MLYCEPANCIPWLNANSAFEEGCVMMNILQFVIELLYDPKLGKSVL